MKTHPHFINANLRDIIRPNALPAALNVGLTGGIASGKSTVARELVARGAALVDLDVIAHSLTQPNGTAMPMLIERFGRAIVAADGSLDRAVMRELVFNDANCKAALEAIVHPLIFKAACERAHELALLSPVFIVHDVPLLAQSPQWQDLLDYIIVVDCNKSERMARLKNRNPQLSDQMIERIIATQATPEELYAMTNVVLDNNQKEPNHLQLNKQINILFRNLIKMAKCRQ